MEELLSIKLRPKSLKDIIGQEHLVGENKVIYNLVKNKKLFSMILYGHPGIGKTSIATAIAEELGMRYRNLNAVVNNKKDFDTVIEEAKLYDGLIVIVDEIHRLNKDKQDILLPYLESGIITLIGMTTSNPYFKINPAIRSRCHIFELKPLSSDDIVEGLKRACQHPDLAGIQIKDDALRAIANLSGSDLRYAYNLLELAYYSSSDKNITLDLLKTINSKPVIVSDKNESGHYDLLSAFQKSIRGSDVDASLHYLARLIEVGDLDSIYRRMSVIAYEDIGLANPDIGPRVMAAIKAAELVGLPEARIPLGDIIVQMALSPKSNSSHLALDSAISDVETGRCGDVPDTIKIHSTIYKYPHDYPNHFVVQQYMPDNIINKSYFKPQDTSPNERMLKQIKEKLDKIKNEEKNKKS